MWLKNIKYDSISVCLLTLSRISQNLFMHTFWYFANHYALFSLRNQSPHTTDGKPLLIYLFLSLCLTSDSLAILWI